MNILEKDHLCVGELNVIRIEIKIYITLFVIL